MESEQRALDPAAPAGAGRDDVGVPVLRRLEDPGDGARIRPRERSAAASAVRPAAMSAALASCAVARPSSRDVRSKLSHASSSRPRYPTPPADASDISISSGPS